MIIKTRAQARSMADVLKLRLNAAKRINQQERTEIEQDIFDLEEYASTGVHPENQWNNVYLWLTGNKYSTLE